MKKEEAHKKYYDKSYFYDSIQTEDINITLAMQKYIYMGQEDFHYTHLKIKLKKKPSRTNKQNTHTHSSFKVDISFIFPKIPKKN